MGRYGCREATATAAVADVLEAFGWRVCASRGDVVVRSNTVEGVFSVFKRGMIGVYQHCGEGRLHRCLAEFDVGCNRHAAPRSPTPNAPEICFAGRITSALPIGGLVKPVTPKQKAPRLLFKRRNG